MLVGSNSSGKFFRVLKFDRQSGIELRLEEEENVFDAKQMRKYLSNLNEIYKSKGGVRHIMNAEAFLGVVTIWNHNYLLFVTKKELVGTIYSKHIFQVKDSALIPITNPNEKKKVSSEETKYRAFFQSVDLSEDFYFSFTYDLTNTLQSNMVEADEKGNNLYQEKFLWNYYPASVFLRSHHNGSHWMVPLIQGFFEQRSKLSFYNQGMHFSQNFLLCSCF